MKYCETFVKVSEAELQPTFAISSRFASSAAETLLIEIMIAMSRHITLCALLLVSRLDAKRGHTMSITMNFDPSMIHHLQAPQISHPITRHDSDLAEIIFPPVLGNSENNSKVFDNNVVGYINIMDYSVPSGDGEDSLTNQIVEGNQELSPQRNAKLDELLEIPDITAGTDRFKANPDQKLENEEQECPYSSSTFPSAFFSAHST